MLSSPRQVKQFEFKIHEIFPEGFANAINKWVRRLQFSPNYNTFAPIIFQTAPKMIVHLREN